MADADESAKQHQLEAVKLYFEYYKHITMLRVAAAACS